MVFPSYQGIMLWKFVVWTMKWEWDDSTQCGLNIFLLQVSICVGLPWLRCRFASEPGTIHHLFFKTVRSYDNCKNWAYLNDKVGYLGHVIQTGIGRRALHTEKAPNSLEIGRKLPSWSLSSAIASLTKTFTRTSQASLLCSKRRRAAELDITDDWRD